MACIGVRGPTGWGDQVFEDHGVKVLDRLESLLYLDGTELDYTKEA